MDTEQIDFDSYLDADLIIIGGGNTEKYIATYVNQEFKNYIDHMLNKGAKVIGFSAGALLLGEKVYVSPNDNSDHQIKIKNGLDDFVRIEGDKAIYQNHWVAGGNEVKWDMIHYDVQLFGGVVLHKGKIAEMATGEGKTLVATHRRSEERRVGKECRSRWSPYH